MSQKTAQVEAELTKAIAKVLHKKISDPRIRGMISITKIKVTSDLKKAFVHVSVLPENYQRMTVDGLNHAKVHIQHLVRKEVALRIVPHFEFRLDESLKKSAGIFAAINEGMKKTGDGEVSGEGESDSTESLPEDEQASE